MSDYIHQAVAEWWCSLAMSWQSILNSLMGSHSIFDWGEQGANGIALMALQVESKDGSILRK